MTNPELRSSDSLRSTTFLGDANLAPNTGIEVPLGIRDGVQTSRNVRDTFPAELDVPKEDALVSKDGPGARIPSMQEIPS